MTQSHHMLIINGDSVSSNLLKFAGEYLGCTVEISSTLQEIETKLHSVDLLVVDHDLSEGGQQLLDRIHQLNSFLPTIITADDPEKIQSNGMAVIRKLRKPVNFEDFICTARSILRASTDIMHIQNAAKRLDQWFTKRGNCGSAQNTDL